VGGRVQIWLPAAARVPTGRPAAEWWRGTDTGEGGWGGELGEESGGVAWAPAAARVPIESGGIRAA
jgi:hypothetical protein